MKLIASLAAAALLTSPSLSAACRDARGKFMKCPAPVAAAKPARCRDAKGHFAKCRTPGAKPA